MAVYATLVASVAEIDLDGFYFGFSYVITSYSIHYTKLYDIKSVT